jgi:DNA invertase Pin-like site-specific DNA recombinase
VDWSTECARLVKDDVLDVVAKFERAKTMERTRRGKQRKEQEDRITIRAAFGFDYNATRDGYVIDLSNFGISSA